MTLITSMHSYKVREVELSYNIKWTILSHVKYIVTTSKVLASLFDSEFTKLREESFIDSLPESRTPYPQFAVDYLGERMNPGGTLGTYVISFRGADNSFMPNSMYGIMTLKRKLQLLHDTIVATLGDSAQEDNSGLKLYDFTAEGNEPAGTGLNFNLSFEETTFEADPATGRQMGGIDWVFSVHL